jgi:hypothetical protein
MHDEGQEHGMQGKTRLMAVACGLVVIATGCTPDTKPTNAKLEKAINSYYEEHNECLFPGGRKFPYEVSPGADAKEEKKQMDAMTDADLLKREEAPAMHVERYTLTAMGERVAAAHFCYGHRVVKSVDSFTPPAKQPNGFTETTVSYHYTMMDVPVWVKTDAMKGAFPKMAASISDDANDQITLATGGAGWQVPE